MADKKYISKIVKSGNTLHLKDAEARQDIADIKSSISDLADIRSGAAAGATALQLSYTITYGGQPYTVEQLLHAVASLMTKTVVADE